VLDEVFWTGLALSAQQLLLLVIAFVLDTGLGSGLLVEVGLAFQSTFLGVSLILQECWEDWVQLVDGAAFLVNSLCCGCAASANTCL